MCELKNADVNVTEEDVYLTLEFDNDEKVKCVVLVVFELDGKEYMALEDDNQEVYLYVYNEISEEEFELLDIESDEEFERVCAEFERLDSEEE